MVEHGYTKGFTTLENVFFFFCIALIALLSAIGVMLLKDQQEEDADVEEARIMTSIVRDYMDRYGIDRLDASEIRSIISQERNFVFNPVQEGKSFWFDIENRRVLVADQYEDFNPTLLEQVDNVSFSRTLSSEQDLRPGEQLEELYEGYLLLDTKGSQIAQAINRIRNLRRAEELTDETSGAIAVLSKFGLGTHAKRFTLDQTLYINDFFGLSEAEDPLSSHHIIFSDHIEIIPSEAILGVGHLLPSELRLPMSVRIIERQAFVTLSPITKIVYDNIDELQLEQDVFHHTNVLNDELKEREGTFQLEQLIIRFDCVISVTKYYSGINGDHYVGKVERETKDRYNYYNEEDVFIGSYDGFDYYDDKGNHVRFGQVYESLVLIKSLFQSATYYETRYNQNLQILTQTQSTEHDLEMHEIETKYRIFDGSILIEVKGYDEYGNLFARGKLLVVDTVPGSRQTDPDPRSFD